jgi:uncharacterized protein involved in response to NO
MAVIRIEEPRSTQPPKGLAPFALGFRPFFLLAGVAAVVLMLLWLLIYSGLVALPAYYHRSWYGNSWHAHEMVFGYTVAVVAGFLLTATRNWTDRPTISGTPLMLLALLWLAGRLLPFVPGISFAVVALVDVLFLPLLALALFIPIVRVKQWHNIIFPLLALLMASGNLLFHYELFGLMSGGVRMGLVLGVYVVLLLIVIMGGRVIPFFVARGAAGAKTRSWRLIEGLSIATLALLALTELLLPNTIVIAAIAVVAALVHGIRLAGWCSRAALRVTLLWVLLLGYGWLVIGFVLLALAAPLELPRTLAWHAFTVGAIGVLTIGMMARVALGHTGRLLQPHWLMGYAFALVNLAALVRVIVVLLWPGHYQLLVVIAGMLWCFGFALFVVIYAPILMRPRVDGKPG